MKFEKEFRKAFPKTVGEIDSHFDLSNYAEFLESLVEENSNSAEHLTRYAFKANSGMKEDEKGYWVKYDDLCSLSYGETNTPKVTICPSCKGVADDNCTDECKINDCAICKGTGKL